MIQIPWSSRFARRALRALAAATLTTVVVQGSACSSGESITAGGPGSPEQAPRDIAGLVTVDHVAVYQGVKVTLVNAGAVVPPNAPVVPGRPALVRVHARTPPRTKTFRLVAELHVQVPGEPDVVVVDLPRTLTSEIVLGDLSSTFNFDLTGDQIRTGASLSVVLKDPTGADPTTARYPVTDPESLEAAPLLPMGVGPIGPTLKVKLVPVRYRADGSNRLPRLDPATVESYKQWLYRTYPVASVELTVREPFDWPLVVTSDGAGWSELLDAVIETRGDDKVADDLYYMGIFDPAATEREYCKEGCILGVAPPSLLSEVGLRTAMVVGYPSARANGTMAQELAHAMGRLHAPCGRPAAIDKKYPYTNATIGTWGWDIVDRQLIDPDERVFDFMSYCDPVWVSDYTFKALYERLVAVAEPSRDPLVAIKAYHLGRDGSMRPGPTVSVRSASSTLASATDSFVLEGLDRRPTGTVRGAFRPTSQIGGGLLLTPEAVPTATLTSTRFARAIAHEK